MLKKILIGIAIVIAVFIIGVVVIYFAVIRPMYKETSMVREMEIAAVDLNQINNGTYLGDFTYGKFTCVVEVVVTDYKIESIKAIKSTGTKHAKMAEGVLTRIVEKQSPKVDAITGATTTSKAFMKAVENALKKGAQK